MAPRADARLPAPPLPGFIARQMPFDRYCVRAAGLSVHVVEHRATPGDVTAAEAPAVVLLHGNPTWSFVWRKVARALDGSGLRAVMPDLAGLGLSEKPRDPRFHTLPNHAAVVSELLDALGLERIVLVVHDWGGAIGLLACVDRPERLAGLVVTNTVLGPPRQGFRPSLFHRFANVPVASSVAFRMLGFPQNVLARTQGDRASIRGAVAAAYRWPLRARADRVAPLALARMAPTTLDHPSVLHLARAETFATSFGGPVAIVWGDRDPILGRALSRVAKTFPQAPVTRTQGGHYLQEEVPEELAAAIREVARRAAR